MKKYEQIFLSDRHKLIADKEESLVAMEQRQLHTKHQTVKEQMKEQYRLQRSQLQRRLTAEIEHMKKAHDKVVMELEIRQRNERKRLPNIQKHEAKTRLNMFKQQLKIESTTNFRSNRSTKSSSSNKSNTPLTDIQFKQQVQAFQNEEIQRMSRERAEQQLKHKKQKDELQDQHQFDMSEMSEHHIDRKKMLAERESDRINALDEAFSRDFIQWQKQVPMRKMLLERKFETQKQAQNEFFNRRSSRPMSGTFSQSTENVNFINSQIRQRTQSQHIVTANLPPYNNGLNYHPERSYTNLGPQNLTASHAHANLPQSTSFSGQNLTPQGNSGPRQNGSLSLSGSLSNVNLNSNEGNYGYGTNVTASAVGMSGNMSSSSSHHSGSNNSSAKNSLNLRQQQQQQRHSHNYYYSTGQKHSINIQNLNSGSSPYTLETYGWGWPMKNIII